MKTPQEEAEKAYREGFLDNDTYYPWDDFYKHSRARRVAEGKE